MYQKQLQIMKQTALKAGEAIMKIYESFSDEMVEYKTDNSPLTSADKESNKIIVALLKQKFPEYAILSEEEQDNYNRLENDYCFIVDPLDGTKEFIKRNGQFTVNIALAYKKRSVVGVIYVPVTRELYFACKGEGAFVSRENEKAKRLTVSNNTTHSELKVVMSNSHGCREMEELIQKYNLKNFVKVGSSLKGCMVASGEADVYYRFNPTMEWDTAAMQCIVEEAGGVFRQMDGNEMVYNRRNSLNDKGFYAINCEKNLLKL